MFCPQVIRLAVVPMVRLGRVIAVARVHYARGSARHDQDGFVAPGGLHDMEFISNESGLQEVRQ